MNGPAEKDPIKVVREGDNGQYQDGVTATWTGYLNGHWTKTAPRRVGRYLVADKEGLVAGYVAIYRDGETGQVVKARDWDGWWWSFPLPPSPVSPPRTWEEPAPTHLRLVENDS